MDIKIVQIRWFISALWISLGRTRVNLNYIGSLCAITVHGSAGHRPFTAFISGARLFVLFNVFAVKSDG